MKKAAKKTATKKTATKKTKKTKSAPVHEPTAARSSNYRPLMKAKQEKAASKGLNEFGHQPDSTFGRIDAMVVSGKSTKLILKTVDKMSEEGGAKRLARWVSHMKSKGHKVAVSDKTGKISIKAA